MKKVIYTLVFCLTLFVGAHANAQGDNLDVALPTADSVDMERLEVLMPSFGLNVSDRLASANDLHRQSALRQIIHDGTDQKYAREDVLNVVRIYRDHRNDNMRRMAVVALSHMNHPWAMDFLARSAPFEKTPQVLHTLVSVLGQEAAPTPDDVPTIARQGD